MPPCDFKMSLYICSFPSSFNPCFSGCRPATYVVLGLCHTMSCFNPCFSGCRPATLRERWCLRKSYCGFNPCFSGCRPATHFSSIMGKRHQICFNPCFSGCRPATIRVFGWCVRGVGVSILVLVDAALRQGGLEQQRLEDYMVSILVLVDAALRHYKNDFLSPVWFCFNPCFSGCRPATNHLQSIFYCQFVFQSLF